MSTRQHKCQYCGKIFWDITRPVEAHVFKKRWKGYVCRDCANWLTYIATENKNLEVIAGVCYEFLPPQTKIGAGDMLGGGRMRYILKKNGDIKKSNDIWTIGEVPTRFRNMLADSGWWISKRLFHRLNKRRFQCKNKGCYDRYHCLLYDIRQEYAEGPYNAIPRNWIVGDEECPSFCNILDVEHYDGFCNIDD